MNITTTLELMLGDGPDLVHQKFVLDSLGDFEAKSVARKKLRLDPVVTVEKFVSLLEGYKLLSSSTRDYSEFLVFRREDHVLFTELRRGYANIDVVSRDLEAKRTLETLVERLKPYEFRNHEDDGVWADFAHLTDRGVSRHTQFLRCPSWADIRGNYAQAAQSRLEDILSMEKPWKTGRLIIWHGPPGTGKTYAIRALMMRWRDRFNYVVVTDPENLAKDPGYYLGVSGDSSEHPKRHWRPELDDDDKDDSGADPNKRCVFVLEDTADLILQESRSEHFDKIGKLLNMTDGLFGQGREDVFLLTFNEDVSRIDPAFLRPGRCIAKVEFPLFHSAEAAEWLRARGAANPLPEGERMTLAGMYARLHESGLGPPGDEGDGKRVGFTSGRAG